MYLYVQYAPVQSCHRPAEIRKSAGQSSNLLLYEYLNLTWVVLVLIPCICSPVRLNY